MLNIIIKHYYCSKQRKNDKIATVAYLKEHKNDYLYLSPNN